VLATRALSIEPKIMLMESVDADLNSSGVVVSYIVDGFGSAHDHLGKGVVPHHTLVALHLGARDVAVSAAARVRTVR
jgi:hypothetical protein